MDNIQRIRFSLPILPSLFLIFVIAKLFGAISWSWWWVAAPLWGPFALVFGILLILFVLSSLILGGAWLIDKLSGR